MKGKVGEQWNKIFMEIFRSMSHGFLLLSPVSLTVRFERSFHSAQVSGKKLSLTFKTDDVTKGRKTWIRTGSYRRFRGEWINNST